MTATLIVLAKLFTTALMPATCSNVFSAAKTFFAATLRFWQRYLSLPKTIFLVVCQSPQKKKFIQKKI
jgi:hypothetical protein